MVSDCTRARSGAALRWSSSTSSPGTRAAGMRKSPISLAITAAPSIAHAAIHRPTFRPTVSAYHQDTRCRRSGRCGARGRRRSGAHRRTLDGRLCLPASRTSAPPPCPIAGGCRRRLRRQAGAATAIRHRPARGGRPRRGNRHGGIRPRAGRQRLRTMSARQGRTELASFRGATRRTLGRRHGDDAAGNSREPAIALASGRRAARTARSDPPRRRRRGRAVPGAEPVSQGARCPTPRFACCRASGIFSISKSPRSSTQSCSVSSRRSSTVGGASGRGARLVPPI